MSDDFNTAVQLLLTLRAFHSMKHTCLMHSTPEHAPANSFPEFGSRITGEMPKNGKVADPGFSNHTPGSGVSI
ncbi:MAG: hypothetical protein HC767_11555 [Akkermansiaceae bacterium]|nr:hypothetical protein [Akkermansiaceae bacterium]